MKNAILLFLLVLPFYFLQAKKFVKADIEYTNGTTKTGYVRFPINTSDNKIKFKTSENGKVKNLDVENMYTITFGGSETVVQLMLTYSKRLKKNKEKLFKRSSWYIVRNACKDLYLLEEATAYKVNKNNELILEYSEDHLPFYLFKKVGEKYATIMDVNEKFPSRIKIGIKHLFRNSSVRFFSSNPELVEKIENEEVKNVFELFSYYCQM